MTPAKVRLAMAAMGHKETKTGALCEELGVTRQTLYRHVSPHRGTAARRREAPEVALGPSAPPAARTAAPARESGPRRRSVSFRPSDKPEDGVNGPLEISACQKR